jgi:hypothetical protein
MPLALVWAALTPGIVWLGRRVPPFGNRRWPLGVALNLLSSVVVVFGTGVFFILNNRWVQGPSPNAPPLLLASLRSLVFWFSSDGLLYAIWRSITARVARASRASGSRARRARGPLEASDAEDAAQPHFSTPSTRSAS